MARNTNRQGANFELEIMHYLTGCRASDPPCANLNHIAWMGYGYDAGRSSGSRGKVDVWAVGPGDTTDEWNRRYNIRPDLLFIQAKITAPRYGLPLSPAERVALMSLALRANALPIVAHKAKDEATGRVRPHFRLLTGPGPRDWVAWEPGEGS